MQSERKDFQGTSGVEIFNRYVKVGDALRLSVLLLNNETIRQKQLTQQAVEIHDIGGADGAMMLALLQVLDITANITVNEPRAERRNAYQNKVITHAQFFKSVAAVPYMMDDIDFILPNQKELILASHVLYYNRNAWLACASIQPHLFTKIFQSLQAGGVFSVVLQSSSLEHDGSHELWEDHIYPLLENTKHSSNTYYANAEEFENALSAYRKQFICENGFPPDWKINIFEAPSVVPIGEINTQADADGKYVQPTEVLPILEFYLKGHDYNSLDSSQQKYIIDLLINHFSKEGSCEITHYNKVYAVTAGEKMLKILAKLSGEYDDACMPR